MKKIIIAIDGHSSCGKSTMAKHLAQKIGYRYIDTGAMYRAVTLFCIQRGLILPSEEVDAEKLSLLLHEITISFGINPLTGFGDTCLNGKNVEKEIRSMAVASLVSPVSTISSVRKKLVLLQQKMGDDKGIVMDGRDVGTTIFPDAELKIFVTASAQVRAQRRYDELLAKGESVSFEEVLHNVEERDRIDSSRKESPLQQAEDAIILDNSYMTIEEQNIWLYDAYRKAIEI